MTVLKLEYSEVVYVWTLSNSDDTALYLKYVRGLKGYVQQQVHRKGEGEGGRAGRPSLRSENT